MIHAERPRTETQNSFQITYITFEILENKVNSREIKQELKT